VASDAQRRMVAERRERVLTMRAAGLTNAQICATEATLKTPAAVSQDVARALEGRSHERAAEGGHLALELERLAALERAAQTVMREAAQGKRSSLVLQAVDRLVKISEQRARLLAASGSAGPVSDGGFDEVAAQRRKRRRGQGW
jgi:hypothetical protein